MRDLGPVTNRRRCTTFLLTPPPLDLQISIMRPNWAPGRGGAHASGRSTWVAANPVNSSERSPLDSEKTARNFLAAVHLVASVAWLDW